MRICAPAPSGPERGLSAWRRVGRPSRQPPSFCSHWAAPGRRDRRPRRAEHRAARHRLAREPPPAAAGPGAPGIGDPDFPGDGNGGYDVEHYALKLGYTPESRHLSGVATIKAKALHELTSFNLDLSGFTIERISVSDGGDSWQRGLAFERSGDELTVAPVNPIPAGAAFTVEVVYAGEPKPVRGSSNLGTYGFIPTRDGAFVTCEPNGAKTWFPGNDHPADKALFDFEITVPAGLTALANGELDGEPVTRDGKTTYVWREKHPMVTYLATMTLGRFELREGETASGIKNLAAVDPRYRDSLDDLYTLSGKITDHWATVFGPYPFSSTGGVVDDFSAGYALENQTKPMYGGSTPTRTSSPTSWPTNGSATA
nr:hypothetical protein GCM10020093_062230 [Planobispora longispora]